MIKPKYRLSKEATLHSHLTRFRRMLRQALQNAEPRTDFNESEWFFSNVEVSNFIGCSVRTVRRLRKQGKLNCIRHKNVCLFRIAEVLRAIAGDYRLAALFTRKRPPRRPKKTPVIRYHCTLRRGWLFIDIRYRGWKCTFVCDPKHKDNDQLIRDLILDIVISRNAYKPFKTISHEKN